MVALSSNHKQLSLGSVMMEFKFVVSCLLDCILLRIKAFKLLRRIR